MLRAPSTQGLTPDEGRVPDYIDRCGVETDDNALERKWDSANRRIRDHDDPVTDRKGLTLQSVDGVRRLEQRLPWDRLDDKPLDLAEVSLRIEFVRRLLQSLDGSLVKLFSKQGHRFKVEDSTILQPLSNLLDASVWVGSVREHVPRTRDSTVVSVEPLEDVGELVLVLCTQLVCGLTELPASIVLPAVPEYLETLGVEFETQSDVVFASVAGLDQDRRHDSGGGKWRDPETPGNQRIGVIAFVRPRTDEARIDSRFVGLVDEVLYIERRFCQHSTASSTPQAELTANSTVKAFSLTSVT